MTTMVASSIANPLQAEALVPSIVADFVEIDVEDEEERSPMPMSAMESRNSTQPARMRMRS